MRPSLVTSHGDGRAICEAGDLFGRVFGPVSKRETSIVGIRAGAAISAARVTTLKRGRRVKARGRGLRSATSGGVRPEALFVDVIVDTPSISMESHQKISIK